MNKTNYFRNSNTSQQGNSGYGGKGNYQEAKPSGKPTNGCKSGYTQKGKIWISGWNVSKDRGMVTVMIGEYEGTKSVTSSSDNKGGAKEHIVLMAEILYKNTGITDHYPVTYCPNTGFVVLKKHGWVLNPKRGHMTRFNPNYNK